MESGIGTELFDVKEDKLCVEEIKTEPQEYTGFVKCEQEENLDDVPASRVYIKEEIHIPNNEDTYAEEQVGYKKEAEEAATEKITIALQPTTLETTKRRREDLRNAADDREDETGQLAISSVNTLDEYSAFGKIVELKIRKLCTRRLRNIAQNKINNILFELEMSEENANADSSF